MKHIRMTLAYDGTDFHGFQRQRVGLPTIQETLEQALSVVCKEPITLFGAGRTDAGVHARGQEVAFTHHSTIPTSRFVYALAPLLPSTISLCKVQEVSPSFHPRKSALAKTYSYTFYTGPVRDPFQIRYTCFEPTALCIEAMKEGASYLIGTHNFSAFRASGSVQTHPVRTLYDVTLSTKGPLVRLHVTGDGFLYHMVRNIAGGLLDVGKSLLAPKELQAILESKDRRNLGKTAPAQGLCMEKVYYTTEELHQGLTLFHSI